MVETSAIIAILISKPAAAQLIAMDQAESLQVSAATVLEASIALESRFGEAGREGLGETLLFCGNGFSCTDVRKTLPIQ